jgi:VPDSG-CTERM motif
MNTKKLLLTAVSVAFLTSSAAFATTISVTGSGTDGALAATADYTFTGTTLTIKLTNDLSAADVRSAGQSLSDFEFTLSNGSTITALTNIAGTAVDLMGSPQNGATVAPGTPVTLDEWSLMPASGTGSFNLTALNGGQPDYMIIGGDVGTTSYPNANNGIGNFNSYLQSFGTFTISGSFADGATLSNISFSFGTGPETIIGVPDSGSTVALLGLAMIGLAAIRARFKKS